MVEILNASGKVIHTSRNLRGLLEHMRHTRVYGVTVHETFDAKHTELGGTIEVQFANGDYCTTNFASFAVMCNFVRTRLRLQGALLHQTCDSAYLHETIIARKNDFLYDHSYPRPGT